MKKQVHSTFFERVEDKFIADKCRKKDLFQFLTDNMHLSEFNQNGEQSLVESIYFDTEDLHFFRAHMSKATERLKVRLRIYGGVKEPTSAFLEIKRKSKEVTHKTRIRIPARDVNSLLKGSGVCFSARDIASLNDGTQIEKLKEDVDLFRQVFLKFNLVPTMRVSYKRVAFEEKGLRVTLDEGLVVEPMTDLHFTDKEVQQCLSLEGTALLNRFQAQDKLVVEVKHSGDLPIWLTGFLQNLDIQKASFSKYCWGLAGQGAQAYV